MTTNDQFRTIEDIPPVAGMSSAALVDSSQQIERVQRIGVRVFDVHSCVILLQHASQGGAKAIGVSVEQAFCMGLPMPAGLVVISDTRLDETLRTHPFVANPPRIRFHAAYPIYDNEQSIIGGIHLVDYLPRIFGYEDRHLLMDLAALVERELRLQSMSALQLDLQRKNKNLRRKSLIDPLIGTWNRGAIMRILTIEAMRCDKAGVPLSLIVADLDYFKKINDTYGHPAGDAILVKIASRLRTCIRSQEALGRYGGEEFLIVLPGSSHATALAVAERMRLAVASQPEVIAGKALHLTISAGVSSTDLFPGASTEELINRADIALYAAKNAGRNRAILATVDSF